MKTMIIAVLMLFVAGAEVANAQMHRRKVVVVHHRVVHRRIVHHPVHHPMHRKVVVVHHR